MRVNSAGRGSVGGARDRDQPDELSVKLRFRVQIRTVQFVGLVKIDGREQQG